MRLDVRLIGCALLLCATLNGCGRPDLAAVKVIGSRDEDGQCVYFVEARALKNLWELWVRLNGAEGATYLRDLPRGQKRIFPIRAAEQGPCRPDVGAEAGDGKVGSVTLPADMVRRSWKKLPIRPGTDLKCRVVAALDIGDPGPLNPCLTALDVHGRAIESSHGQIVSCAANVAAETTTYCAHHFRAACDQIHDVTVTHHGGEVTRSLVQEDLPVRSCKRAGPMTLMIDVGPTVPVWLRQGGAHGVLLTRDGSIMGWGQDVSATGERSKLSLTNVDGTAPGCDGAARLALLRVH